MRLQQLALLCAFVYAASTTLASAQSAPAPATDVPPPPPPPPPPPAPAQPAPGQPAQPVPDVPPPPPSYQSPPVEPGAAGGDCTPACRAGFLCQQGQCVSACNPPCAAGQRCTAEAECVADANAVPAPFPAQPGPAIEPPPEEGFEQHDGFMLRATIGFGGGKITRNGSTGDFVANDAEFTGAGLLWSLDVGGSPIDNLVVHGRISQVAIGSPDTTFDDDEQGTLEELSVGAVLIGPAVSYYVMPINIYATAAVGLGVVVITHEDDEDAEASSDAGLGLNFDVGKEWWVNANWGLGVAGRFWYTAAKDEEADSAEFECIGGGLLFSATYQ